MACEKILDRICDELGEAVDSDLCQEIKEHLRTCPDCQAYVDSVRKTVYLYRGICDEEEVPKGVHERLWQVLDLTEKK